MTRPGSPLLLRSAPGGADRREPDPPAPAPPAATYFPTAPLAAPVVTFDKGARVARLEPGAVLDARQVGILLAQLDGTDRRGRLIDWDRAHDPGATRRIDDLIAAKGPEAKTTLMIALSMGVLRAFEVHDTESGQVVRLEGERGRGYTVRVVGPSGT